MPKTLLILGAGASSPYGFPLGNSLIDMIIDSTKKRQNHDSSLYPLLRQRFEELEIDKFRTHLAQCEVDSIDSFLYHNQEYLEIGKACIAFNLLQCEATYSYSEIQQDDNWYKYLWNELASREPEIFDFKIYTFNYERSLYNYLLEQAKLLFPDSQIRTRFIENIKIIHLHGTLGDVKYGDIQSIHNYTGLKAVSDNIKIIFEVETDVNFQNFQSDIKNANHIVFVGFGFHEDNMKRMGFSVGDFNKAPHFYASTFKLKNAQIETKLIRYVKAALKSHFNLSTFNIDPYLSFSDSKSLEFLKELFPFHHLFKS